MSEFWPDESEQSPSIVDEIRDKVAIITFNRPECLNAWTPAMGTRYFNTLERLAKDQAVNVILVRGAGRGFCAGADLKGLGNIAASGGETPDRDTRPYWYPMSIGKPIVAAIHGACYTVGLQQALCCDVRFCSSSARFAVPYAKRGLVAEVGISWLLSRVIGMPNTMEWLMSSRVVDGLQAQDAGLVSQLFEDDEALFTGAFEYCRSIAAEASPWSLRTMKEQVYHNLMMDLLPAFEQSEQRLQEALSSQDFVEGLNAFREKRSPDFAPLDPDLAHLGPWPGE